MTGLVPIPAVPTTVLVTGILQLDVTTTLATTLTVVPMTKLVIIILLGFVTTEVASITTLVEFAEDSELFQVVPTMAPATLISAPIATMDLACT
jgi:hypothetical protein